MLSDDQAGAMKAWVHAANSWSLSAQTIVRTSTTLATESRDLADSLGGAVASASIKGESGEPPLAVELRRLAEAVESDSAELRDRYLATAATLGEFSDVLD